MKHQSLWRPAALTLLVIGTAGWFAGLHTGQRSHVHAIAMGAQPKPAAHVQATRALPAIGEMDRARSHPSHGGVAFDSMTGLQKTAIDGKTNRAPDEAAGEPNSGGSDSEPDEEDDDEEGETE
ncbi:hypothetical protein [Alicyclobacillus sp.]|uniref:hypothetical protein n=1 Tax=Alicyclobacillus sp. TaxID=61169 RepID=UPI0025BC90C4|nr:hypothetical protein [Alicyclobacillus sp.]MCL6517944.1 hypothetical protein [Alicyclobacillus sp.]